MRQPAGPAAIPSPRVVCLTLVLCAGPAFAWPADDARDEQPDRRLPRVAVEAESPPPLERASTAGGRLGLTLREAPASVDIIDQEALRARGETTFVEAFDNAPGLSTGACFGVFCISARGFSSHWRSRSCSTACAIPGWPPRRG